MLPVIEIELDEATYYTLNLVERIGKALRDAGVKYSAIRVKIKESK